MKNVQPNSEQPEYKENIVQWIGPGPIWLDFGGIQSGLIY